MAYFSLNKLLQIIVITTWWLSPATASISAPLQVSNLKINQVTSYTFNLTPQSNLSPSSYIIFDLDADGSSGITVESSVSCTQNFGFSANPSCTRQSSTQVKMALTRMTGTILSVQINNIKNPPSAKTLNSEIIVRAYSGSTLVESSNGSPVVFEPNTDDVSGSISTSNPTVGSYSDFTASVTVKYDVPADGTVEVWFPLYDDKNLGAVFPFSMQNNFISGCSITGNTPSCISYASTDGGYTDHVTFSNAFTQSGGLSAGQTFDLKILNVRNPPTLQPRSNFSVFTGDSAGNYIDQAADLTLTLTTVATFTSAGNSYASLTGDTGMGQLGTYQFFHALGNSVPAGGSIRLTIPTQVSYSGINTLSVTGNANINSRVTVTQGSSSRELILDDCFPSYLNAGYGIMFSLRGLKNPETSSETDSFALATFDESGFAIEKLDFGLEVQATSGSLTNAEFYPLETLGVYEYASRFQVSFQIESVLDRDASIIISFTTNPDSKYDFQIYSDQLCSVEDLDFGVDAEDISCQAYSSTKTIVISDWIRSGTISDTVVSFVLSGVRIRNPGTTKAEAIVNMMTSNGSYNLDVGESEFFTPEAAAFSSVTVAPNNLQTNIKDVEYLFTVQAVGPIAQGSFLQLTLPDDITVSNEWKIQQRCDDYYTSGVQEVGSLRNPRLSCTVRRNKVIWIRRLFEYQDTDDYPFFQFTIPGIQNPRLVAQLSGSFVLEIFEDEDRDYPIFTKSEGITVTMLAASPFGRVLIERDETYNRATTTFHFGIQTLADVIDTDLITFQFPAGHTLRQNATEPIVCTGESMRIYNVLECDQISNDTVQVKMKFLSNGRRELASYLQNFKVGISNIGNSPTTEPSQSFILAHYNSQGRMIDYSSSDIVIENSGGYPLKPYQFNVYPTKFTLGKEVTYAVSFNPESYVQNMNIKIELPPEITPNTIKCEPLSLGVDQSIDCVYSKTDNILKVYKAFESYEEEPEEIKFSIGNFTNPSELLETGSFKVKSFTENDYLIDELTSGMTLNFICATPCKTCLEGTNDQCATCFTDGYTTDKPILYDDYCFASCPPSTFADEDNLCQPCASPLCSSCGGSARTQCTVCFKGSTLLNGVCVEDKDSEVTYYLPFLILAVIWTTICTITRCKRKTTRFSAMMLYGLSTISFALALFEVITYASYNMASVLLMFIGFGILIPFFIQIAFGIVLLRVHRKHQQFRNFISEHKCWGMTHIVLSLLVSYRCIKALYFGPWKSSFDMNVLSEDKNPKRRQNLRALNMWFSYMLLLSDGGLVAGTVSALQQGQRQYLDIMKVRMIAFERLAISFALFLFTIFEFIKSCNKDITKIHNGRRIKMSSAYMEADQTSIADMTLASRAAQRLRRKLTIQMLKAGTKHLSKKEVNEQLDDLIQEEEFGLELQRRSSFHELPETKGVQKVKLVRFAPKKGRLQDSDDEGGYMSDPLILSSNSETQRLFQQTPGLRKFGIDCHDLFFGEQTSISVTKFRREKAVFLPSNVKMPKSPSVGTVGSVDSQLHKRLLRAEATLIEHQRLLEQRAALQLVGQHSASTGLKDKDLINDRSKEWLVEKDSKHQLSKQGSAIGEGNIEQMDFMTEKDNFSLDGSARPINIELQKRSIDEFDSRNVGERDGTDRLAATHLPGTLPETVPGTAQSNRRRCNIFYSDKSESSVEDLMDITPTTFNTQNGRLGGKSTGLRLQAKLERRAVAKGRLNANEEGEDDRIIAYAGGTVGEDSKEDEMDSGENNSGQMLRSLPIVGGDDIKPEVSVVDLHVVDEDGNIKLDLNKNPKRASTSAASRAETSMPVSTTQIGRSGTAMGGVSSQEPYADMFEGNQRKMSATSSGGADQQAEEISGGKRTRSPAGKAPAQKVGLLGVKSIFKSDKPFFRLADTDKDKSFNNFGARSKSVMRDERRKMNMTNRNEEVNKLFQTAGKETFDRSQRVISDRS